ncbi:hypothetical protein QTO34_012977 [Cnephaeus nilssonii]|uniref:CS domain-containing protein n=1 Tax=Cnephaeus nilssonii TaxID=3371016 RepID=A0AA40HA42_CNENI|nr:hypothetical protein QTO34_012977 [Eptesicus nilssonii]
MKGDDKKKSKDPKAESMGKNDKVKRNVQVHFTERSFDLLVKNLNGKNYSMIVNNLLKPISVEGSSKKTQDRYSHYLMQKESRRHTVDYLTQILVMNVLKKICEDGDEDMKRTINKAWVQSRCAATGETVSVSYKTCAYRAIQPRLYPGRQATPTLKPARADSEHFTCHSPEPK